MLTSIHLNCQNVCNRLNTRILQNIFCLFFHLHCLFFSVVLFVFCILFSISNTTLNLLFCWIKKILILVNQIANSLLLTRRICNVFKEGRCTKSIGESRPSPICLIFCQKNTQYVSCDKTVCKIRSWVQTLFYRQARNLYNFKRHAGFSVFYKQIGSCSQGLLYQLRNIFVDLLSKK